MPSVEEATATLTTPGALFEMDEAEIRGITTRIWKHAPATLRNILELSAFHGDSDFLVYEDERITFAEHYRLVATLANALVDRFGVAPGDRVAIAMRNLPEWAIAFWAIAACGAVVVPLNAWWTGDELAYGLSDSACTVVFADEEREERLRPHVAELPDLTAVVVVSERRDGDRRAVVEPATLDRAGVEPLPIVPFPQLVDGPAEDATLPAVDIAPDDDATIFYTSGTTGRPKGAVGTHRNTCSNLMNLFFVSSVGSLRRSGQLADTSGGGQNANLLSVPLFHATGCHAVLITNTAAGGKLVMMHHFDPARALELIERERITIFGGVPAMVMEIIDAPEIRQPRHVVGALHLLRRGAGAAGPGPPDPRALPRRPARQRLRPYRDLRHDHHELRR